MYISRQTLQGLGITALSEREQTAYTQAFEEAVTWRVALDLFEVLSDQEQEHIRELMRSNDAEELRRFLKPVADKHRDVVRNAVSAVYDDLAQFDAKQTQ